MNNNVVMIKRELLHPHPDNPRKEWETILDGTSELYVKEAEK